MELGNKNGLSYRIKWLWQIIKHGAFLLGVRNRLARIGLDFMPYYWVIEEAEPITPPVLRDNNPKDYEMSYFGSEELNIVHSKISGIGHKNLHQNIKDGQICVGLKKNDDIVAYMFIQTESFTFRGKTFHLSSDEAYLKDMYTFEEYRGKNIAPYLRYKTYLILKEKGINRKYSISEYFNKPTIRFKKKLNSQHLALFLSIRLFNRFTWNIRLKDFSQGFDGALSRQSAF